MSAITSLQIAAHLFEARSTSRPPENNHTMASRVHACEVSGNGPVRLKRKARSFAWLASGFAVIWDGVNTSTLITL
jgi:hypothetical protein